MKTKYLVEAICLFTAVILVKGTALAGDVADFRVDITGETNNPHADTIETGTWSYWRSDTVNPSDAGANLTAYVWNATNIEFRDPNGTGYGQVRQTNLHPGTGNYTAVRWKAGSNGTYAVNGFFQRQVNSTSGDGVSVFVYVDGEMHPISTNSIPAVTGYPKASFNFITSLNQGEYIDFIVYGNDAISSDRTDFDANISTAASGVIINWSFQNPDYTPGGTEAGAVVPGWIVEKSAGTGIQLDNKGGSPPAPDGDQWCYFNLVANKSGEGGNAGSLWQDIGYVMDKHIYTAKFTLGNRSVNSAGGITTLGLWHGGSAPSTSAGSTLIGETSFTFPPVSSTITKTNQTSFTTGSNLNYAKLWLRFDISIPAGSSGAWEQLLLDAVILEVIQDMSTMGTIILIQ